MGACQKMSLIHTPTKVTSRKEWMDKKFRLNVALVVTLVEITTHFGIIFIQREWIEKASPLTWDRMKISNRSGTSGQNNMSEKWRERERPREKFHLRFNRCSTEIDVDIVTVHRSSPSKWFHYSDFGVCALSININRSFVRCFLAACSENSLLVHVRVALLSDGQNRCPENHRSIDVRVRHRIVWLPPIIWCSYNICFFKRFFVLCHQYFSRSRSFA